MKKYMISSSLWYCEFHNGKWTPLWKLIPEDVSV